MNFVFEKIDSTASSLYLVKAIDDDGKLDMQWQIACDNESQLESVAQEAYELSKNPPQNY